MTEFGESGKEIWLAYGGDQLDAGAKALVRAYAHCADIADRLSNLAAAKQETWATLVYDDMGEVHLSIDKVLDQARAQQLALRAIYAEMRQSGIKPAASVAAASVAAGPEDVLARRRKEREERERQFG